MSMKSIPVIDLFSTEFKKNAYEIYKQLRKENPIRFISTMPSRRRAWLFTRYQDTVGIFKDKRFSKNPRKFLTPLEQEEYCTQI